VVKTGGERERERERERQRERERGSLGEGGRDGEKNVRE
jgi:hypothetical protein